MHMVIQLNTLFYQAPQAQRESGQIPATMDSGLGQLSNPGMQGPALSRRR